MANYPNFCGQDYVSSSTAVDCSRSMNLYPELLAAVATDPKARIVLRRRPGLALLQTLPDKPGRGKFTISGRDFAVCGGSFFELLTPTTYILRGSIPYGILPVQMRCNGTQICLLADGLGYIFTLATNAFQQITGQAGFPAYAVSLESIDTYFIALGQNSNQFGVSNPLDGLTWSALSFGSSQEPDNAVAIAQSHLYLWIFGQQETIIFQDTGASSSPFARVGNSQIEQGCGAVNSVAVCDNSLFWLGADARGAAVIYRANGFLPTRISTQAIEEAIQKYPQTSDAVAYAYQESGHLFYVVDFPSANAGAGATWAYDVVGDMWHERGYWNTATGSYSSMLSRFHSFCFGKHVVLDYTSGNVYEQSRNYATDNGALIRWLRAAPHLHTSDLRRLFYKSFWLDMETGAGLPGNLAAVVCLRWSDDGGFTWRTPRMLNAGQIGQYRIRVKSFRNGYAVSRVYEASGSDPLPNLTLIAATLDIEQGTT